MYPIQLIVELLKQRLQAILNVVQIYTNGCNNSYDQLAVF